MTTSSFVYSDFYVDFNIHPVKADLSVATDNASISTSIKNILFTNKYERPFAPQRGAGILRTLFENATTDTAFMIETLVREAIDADEPRATNVKVAVVSSIDRNGYVLTVIYTPINSLQPVTVEAIFKRVR